MYSMIWNYGTTLIVIVITGGLSVITMRGILTHLDQVAIVIAP